MFEKKIKEISDELGGDKREYFILTHKKHHREIYFQNNSKAIKFIKIKFDSSLRKFKKIKGIIYLLIRLQILQPFLKRIKLSKNLGNVIFIGEQIKCFGLNKKIVVSFPLNEKGKINFLKSKKYQKKIGKKGFAPKITELNGKFPYSKEDLLNVSKNKDYKDAFKKLLDFYQKEGIKKISIKTHIGKLLKRIEVEKIDDKEINLILKKLYKNKTELLMTSIHGDFARDHILVKDNNLLFIDWNPKKGLIISDLMNFFSNEEKSKKIELLKNKNFFQLLELYPPSVKKDLTLYMILDEISSIIEGKGHCDLSKKRIKKLGPIFSSGKSH